jgi:hypothetical protein
MELVLLKGQVKLIKVFWITFNSKSKSNLFRTYYEHFITKFYLKHKTATTNSSANILPKSLKLNESGLVKSSNMLIGRWIELLKFFLKISICFKRAYCLK